MAFINNFGCSIKSVQDVMLELALRFKNYRLSQNITQKELAERATIAVGTLKRFEKTGEIQLHHLLKISLILNKLEDFDLICQINERPVSLFDLTHKKERKRERTK